jgi:DNA excision repair protein ERCC-5
MGVNGLWQVVQPCARPTNLATLNRKRLAVDASIWIYQFLKAVRDKEGNALRNSHVVGFFRRICKLLWFGIRPVFVFDGGAPALKRQTILGRKRRREGRREDTVRTAGKLLAVQMQRIAEEAEEKRRRQANREEVFEEPQEEIPDVDKLVYVDEIGMLQKERQKTRKFYKQDAYHLPDLDGGGIAASAGTNDPRIMSIEELEEYARQFHNGEDINLYDFSKIDFDGDFFRSLPPVDRYNILNAARLRSRLRLGLTKEQLEEMFPDRMAFSRFQIERVKERNNLTQRLMREAGMTGLDLTLGAGGGRIAGDKDREYILVKNAGVEGGWALGVVSSKETGAGEINNPIDVDELEFNYQKKTDEDEWQDYEDFVDVPIEGLNRLPKMSADMQVERGLKVARDILSRRNEVYSSRRADRRAASLRVANDPVDQVEDETLEDEDSLFVGGDGTKDINDLFEEKAGETLHPEEEDDINRAIALSLQSQHGAPMETPDDEVEFEDVPTVEPKWNQKAVEATKPISSANGRMVAHIVNNRSNAAVPKRRESDASSDSDIDLQAALAASRRARKTQPTPTIPNVKNPFDGPLPFPKLDWGSSIFKKSRPAPAKARTAEVATYEPESDEDGLAGGFETDAQDDAPKPLPPWLSNQIDIRESLEKRSSSACFERDSGMPSLRSSRLLTTIVTSRSSRLLLLQK